MLLPVITVLISLVVLSWSADKFVVGASATASRLGVSSLLIGLTVVSFGTSAPEMLIAAMSASTGSSAIAIGNAIGSNIANIALILGAASLFMPMPVSSAVLRREIPLLLAVVFFSAALLLDLNLSRLDALASITVLFMVLGWLIYQGKKHPADPLGQELEHSIEAQNNHPKNPIALTIIALLVLLVSSRALVWGAVEIARAAQISELMIGLSIIAVGTSLPELAATIASVLRREYDLAIGSVVGSNIFNALAVTGIVALLAPGDIDMAVRNRDLPVQLVVTVLLFVFAVGRDNKPGRINRFEGLLFVAIFIAYQYWLFSGETALG